MLENQSIICFANDWENDPTSKHQVMKILARSNKILWVNSIAMRNPGLSKADAGRIFLKIKGFFKGLTKVSDNLFHFTPIVLPFPTIRIAKALNRVILRASIAHFLKKLRMTKVQLWTFMPNVGHLVGSFGEKLVVYYCVDEWSKFSFVDGKAIREQEVQLLKKADLVLTSAEYLFEDKRRFNPNTHLITHGVDYAYFSKALDDATPLAEELRGIQRPIIGFFGLIHEWIDLRLLEEIARARPDWSVVLIGKVSADVERLRKLQNVHFLGQKPYEGLVTFCKGFDVGLIPFAINDLTVNVNPIKLREYLAAGLAVVSTPLPEVLRYDGLVSIGNSPDEVVRKIELELHQNTKEKRMERAQKMREETWEKKVNRISDLVTAAVCDRGEDLE